MSNHERIEILDDTGKSLGHMSRLEAEDANHLTQNVLLFIFTPTGQVWTQLRPTSKKHYPGRWDISTCGGIVHGETPLQAAQREQQEEMGFTCPLTFVETFLNVFPGDHGETRRRLSHLYIGVSGAEPQLSDEVDEFKSWEPALLRAEIIKYPDQFIPPILVELDKALVAYKLAGDHA